MALDHSLNNKGVSKNTILLFLGLLFLGLLQATFTPVNYDEAYYRLFAFQLDWGYFDHPPAVAFMIYCSQLVCSEGALSIRFFHVLAFVGYICLAWVLVRQLTQRTMIHFIFIVFLLPLHHLLSFVATPDGPLIFSAMVFTYFYSLLLKEERWVYFVGLSLSMALMMYAKYHAALYIFVMLISNYKRILKWPWVLAVCAAVIMYLPHLNWQFSHDWISLKYHLVDRKTTGFLWKYPLEYLINLVIVFNPFLLYFIWKVLKKKYNDPLLKTCKWTVIVFIVFFFYQSFQTHVQAQWFYLCYIPILLLLAKEESLFNKKILRWGFVFFIPLFIGARFFIASPFNQMPSLGWERYEKYKNRIQPIDSKWPLVFLNNYKNASLYAYYTGAKVAHTHNLVNNRRNQFDIWMTDTLYHNREVVLVEPDFSPQRNANGELKTILYKAFDKVEIKSAIKLDSNQYQLIIFNPYPHQLEFSRQNIDLKYLNIDGAHEVVFPLSYEPFLLDSKEEKTINVRLPRVKSKYRIAIALEYKAVGLSAPKIVLPSFSEN